MPFFAASGNGHASRRGLLLSRRQLERAVCSVTLCYSGAFSISASNCYCAVRALHHAASRAGKRRRKTRTRGVSNSTAGSPQRSITLGRGISHAKAESREAQTEDPKESLPIADCQAQV